MYESKDTKIDDNSDVKLSNITEQEKFKSFDIVEGIVNIDTIGQKLCETRKRPLLLLYYNNQCGQITPADLEYLEEVLEKIEKPVSEMDLLIHTRGGEVSTSYFIAQLIRSKCNKLYSIIPTFSFSGGTAIVLASDHIELHTTSQLSPIDIQIHEDKSDDAFPLLNLDGFRDFIDETTKSFELNEEKNKTEIIARLMVEFCKQVHPFNLGELFRLRKLHEIYAKVLLLTYMFRHDSDKEKKAKDVIQNLTAGSPAHEFNIDIKLAKQFGLNVKEMEKSIYKLSKSLINICIEKEHNGIIAQFIDRSNNFKLPYFQLFIPAQTNV